MPWLASSRLSAREAALRIGILREIGKKTAELIVNSAEELGLSIHRRRRLTSFSLAICPSVWSFDQGDVMAAAMAAPYA